MRVNDLSCIGFEFSINGNEDGLEKLKANFTFKFPAKTGYFYHVPTYSPVNTINPAIWDTRTRRGTYSYYEHVSLCCKNITILIVYDIFETHYILLANLTSIILDTDYSQWAVLAQCKTSADGQSIEYLSTRSVLTTFYFQLSYTNNSGYSPNNFF